MVKRDSIIGALDDGSGKYIAQNIPFPDIFEGSAKKITLVFLNKFLKVTVSMRALSRFHILKSIFRYQSVQNCSQKCVVENFFQCAYSSA